MEIGVRVGGLPGEVRRVSGTSVVHYELIRGGSVQLCVCLCVCVLKMGLDRMKRGRGPSHVVGTVCACVCMCPCVSMGDDEVLHLNLSKQQKARSPRMFSADPHSPRECGT